MAINNLVWPGDQLLCIHFCMHVCTVRVYVCVCVCVCMCVSARARYNLGPLALFFPLAYLQREVNDSPAILTN